MVNPIQVCSKLLVKSSRVSSVSYSVVCPQNFGIPGKSFLISVYPSSDHDNPRPIPLFTESICFTSNQIILTAIKGERGSNSRISLSQSFKVGKVRNSKYSKNVLYCLSQRSRSLKKPNRISACPTGKGLQTSCKSSFWVFTGHTP